MVTWRELEGRFRDAAKAGPVTAVWFERGWEHPDGKLVSVDRVHELRLTDRPVWTLQGNRADIVERFRILAQAADALLTGAQPGDEDRWLDVLRRHHRLCNIRPPMLGAAYDTRRRVSMQIVEIEDAAKASASVCERFAVENKPAASSTSSVETPQAQNATRPRRRRRPLPPGFVDAVRRYQEQNNFVGKTELFAAQLSISPKTLRKLLNADPSVSDAVRDRVATEIGFQRVSKLER